MDASTVYSVAKALPIEELEKLYHMLKSEMYPVYIPKRSEEVERNDVRYTDSDALEYLFDKLNL